MLYNQSLPCLVRGHRATVEPRGLIYRLGLAVQRQRHGAEML